MSHVGTEVEVRIRNIAVGGSGVGEVCAQKNGYQDLLGITAFVPFTSPGERVLARIDDTRNRYLNASLLSVEEPSPARVQPECPLFTQCGGCELQHLSYEGQLTAKHAMIHGSLRAAKLSQSDLERLRPVIGGDGYQYRRRVTLHIDSEGKVGFYRGASRSVIPVPNCPVSVPLINDVLPGLPEFGKSVRGKISTVILDADDNGIVAVLKSPYPIGTAEKQTLLNHAKKFFQNVSLVGPNGEIGGFGRQIVDLNVSEAPPISIRVPAGHFSQVNAKINRQLIRKTIEAVPLSSSHVLFDLYSGAGNFSVPIAFTGAQVFAVECDKRLVNFARENAAKYRLEKNLQVKEASVERFLEKPPKVSKLHTILADPPRSGLGPLVDELPDADTLLLISCHLPSCARDLKALTEKRWSIESIQPFDMFAQTSYVEILTVLRRS